MYKYEVIITNEAQLEQTNGQYGKHTGYFVTLEEVNEFVAYQTSLPNRAPSEVTIEINNILSISQQKKINADSQAYLLETDWLVIREMDSGEPVPLNIKQARALARSKIV
jgi:hypothetical protein